MRRSRPKWGRRSNTPRKPGLCIKRSNRQYQAGSNPTHSYYQKKEDEGTSNARMDNDRTAVTYYFKTSREALKEMMQVMNDWHRSDFFKTPEIR